MKKATTKVNNHGELKNNCITQVYWKDVDIETKENWLGK